MLLLGAGLGDAMLGAGMLGMTVLGSGDKFGSQITKLLAWSACDADVHDLKREGDVVSLPPQRWGQEAGNRFRIYAVAGLHRVRNGALQPREGHCFGSERTIRARVRSNLALFGRTPLLQLCHSRKELLLLFLHRTDGCDALQDTMKCSRSPLTMPKCSKSHPQIGSMKAHILICLSESDHATCLRL
eukprot:Skav223651  [mRNA]  locus=scaffold46:749821:753056:- [translate_table: standard]